MQTPPELLAVLKAYREANDEVQAAIMLEAAVTFVADLSRAGQVLKQIADLPREQHGTAVWMAKQADIGLKSRELPPSRDGQFPRALRDFGRHRESWPFPILK